MQLLENTFTFSVVYIFLPYTLSAAGQQTCPHNVKTGAAQLSITNTCYTLQEKMSLTCHRMFNYLKRKETTFIGQVNPNLNLTGY